MKSCRSCGSSKIHQVVDLGSLHLNEFRSDDIVPPVFPLSLDLCSECSLVQLGQSVDPVLIYTNDYGFESGVNNSVKADLAEIVTAAKELVNLEMDDVVIDIGCNDGTLLSNYKDDGLMTIGIDPVEKFREKSVHQAVHIITGFFSYELIEDNIGKVKAKIITSISMFYDLEDPAEFCRDVCDLLHDDGIWIVQQNYLSTMLALNAYDNIVHQHVEYYSMRSMMHLLRRHGLRIFRVDLNHVNGGSFRTFICKVDSKFVTEPNVQILLDQEFRSELDRPVAYVEFAKRIEELSYELFELVTHLVYGKEKTVYIYGASTRGDTLLQVSELHDGLLPFAVERNPDKVGKKISSLQIPIISEEQAREEKPDYMLVLPWFFFNEFRTREMDYIVNGGKFILPLPVVETYGVGIIKDEHDRT